jgi:hypothetical protein
MEESPIPLDPEIRLPPELLRRATRRGNEYAWPISDIPKVIEAARAANLVSIGGQLQFRPPGATCECYWVEVDTYWFVPTSLPWAERVVQTAKAALASFARLQTQYDFFEEGWRTFPVVFDDLARKGHDLREAMCFVWYLEAPESDKPAD